MQVCDLPYQGKSQPCSAILPAAGLVYPEKGLEDAALKFLRDAPPGVGNAKKKLLVSLRYQNPHQAAGAVVLDGVFRQIKEQAIDQRVAASQASIPLLFQPDAVFLRQRSQICKDFLDQG